MDPPYQYNLPAGTHLFRAKTIAKEGRWYALKLEDIFRYGREITEYSTTKDLKLLNIMSLTFHNDFMDRLNTLYPGKDYDGYDLDKLKCLIPLGLVDLQSQTKFANVFGHTLQTYDLSWNELKDITNAPLLNRHRLSEHHLDTHLVSVLEQIYGHHYDGYISPLEWPSKLGENNFHREVCLFKIRNIKEEGTYIITQTGGEQKTHLTQSPPAIQKSPFTNYSKFYELQEKYSQKPISYTSIMIPSKPGDSIPQYNIYLNNTHEKNHEKKIPQSKTRRRNRKTT
jgi:hypothetical protein